MSEEVKNEIEEMNKAFDSVLEGIKPKEPEPKVEEKKEEPPPEPKPEDDKPPEDPKEEEPKKEEKPPEPVPDDRDKTIETLRLELAEFKAKKAEVPTEKKEPESKPEPPKIEDQDFVGERDLDELTRDPKEFNKLLNDIYRKARSDSEQALIESLPGRINSQVATLNAMAKATEDFYTANEDLKPFGKVVSVVFGEVMESNPNRTLDELLSDVSKEVRTRLGLPKKDAKLKEVKKEDSDEKPPKLPKKDSSSGRPSAKPESENELQSQLDQMTKAVKG